VLRRLLAFPVIVSGALLLMALALLSLGFKSDRKTSSSPPAAPRDVHVTFNFQGGPNLVFLCWSDPAPAGVNFYDVELERWNNGQPRQEVRYGVSTTACGDALGVGEYMFDPDLYHYAVRACNNAGCSGWADASEADRYWFAMPCSDPGGNACARPQDAAAGTR
jgi:hypothetical protein